MSVQDVTLQVALEAIQSSQQVVVDFYSNSCGPCKALSGVLDSVAAENESVVILKVNAEEPDAHAYFQEQGFRGVPTVLFFKDGKEAKRQAGYMPKSKFVEVMSAALG